MLANLGQSYRLVFSGAVLLALVDKGMLREDAYRVVQDTAMHAWREGVDFGLLIKQNEEAMAVMTPKEIETAMDPDQYRAGRDVIFDRLENLEF
jgi:adenylosuccinate lyase